MIYSTMKVFFTSSNDLATITDTLVARYSKIGVEVLDNAQHADVIVSTENMNHVTETKADMCILFGSDKRFRKCVNLFKMPRISNAQCMDVLSSLSFMLGYQAGVLAVSTFDSVIPMTNVTGTYFPGVKAMVFGIGIAGLNAIATLSRMGAQVIGLDISNTMEESVLSMNASFICMQNARTDTIAEYICKYRPNIIITSVCTVVPPLLITTDILNMISYKCLIIDVSTKGSGCRNCEFAVDRTTYCYKDNITIMGASSMARFIHDTSVIYSNNIFNLLSLYIKDPDHEIFSAMIEYNSEML